MSYCAKDKCGMMIYHLNTGRIGPSEMRRVANKGYCNGYTVGISGETGQAIMQARLAKETGDNLWIGTGVYNSKKQTIGEYMKQFETPVKKLKDEGLWDCFVGFHWDEPLLHNPSNDDFLEMTRALTEEYGLRIYPVFSTYEITGHKGNASDPNGMVQFEKYASKYITDIGFDCYGYDVRPEYAHTLQGHIKEAFSEKIPTIVDGQSYYREYVKLLKALMEGEPNIWYYPCAYHVYTWGGYCSDEDYCIAHLDFFLDELKKQEHPGGIHLYTWKTWTYKEPALDILLDRDNPERWERYEAKIQQVCKEVANMKLNPAK